MMSGCSVQLLFFFFFKQKTAYEMRISDLEFRRVLFRSFQHPVEQHDVGYILLRHQQCFFAVCRMGDLEIFPLEMPDEQFRQRGIILDQQHFRACHAYYSDSCSGSDPPRSRRSEEHTSELQSLMRISYAVFCLKKKKTTKQLQH